MIYLRNSDLKINNVPVAFAQIYNYDGINDSIGFTEYVIKETDDKYFIVGWANSIEEFNNKSDSYLDSGYIYVEIHKKPYKQWDYKTKTETERSVDEVEQVICHAILQELIHTDTVYSGYLQLGTSRPIKNLLALNTFEPEDLGSILQMCLMVNPVKDPQLITPEVDISVVAGGNLANNGTGKKQFSKVTEYQKLQDREKFLIEQINALNAFPNGCITLADYSRQYNSDAIDDKTAELIQSHIKLVLGMMK